MQQTLVVTPLGNLSNMMQLVGAQVQSEVFDDPLYRHELYVGTIDQVKMSRAGTFVRFQSDALVSKKWVALHRVKGWAHYKTEKATA